MDVGIAWKPGVDGSQDKPDRKRVNSALDCNATSGARTRGGKKVKQKKKAKGPAILLRKANINSESPAATNI